MTDLNLRLAQLKEDRNAVILAHVYQRAEVQDAADFVGDSLGLSQQAKQTDSDVILFCGVHFMAETAAIVCPEKTVLMPDANAGCPMANMLTVRQLRAKKQEHPGAVVVCYVNSSAAVKAESDICCTSANAVEVVRSIEREKEVIFVPDASLGGYVGRMLDRPMILWPGYCPTHHRILAEDVLMLKQAHPAAKAAVHPECTEDVLALADFIGSTSAILDYCRQTDAPEFVVGTEIGVRHQLQQENPDKVFYMIEQLADCPNMKLTTLEKMVWALEDMQPRVTVDEETAGRARQAIERMLAIPRTR